MVLKWTNTISFVMMVAVNALANLIPIGGYTTMQISGMYPNLFTPAPATFAIWGVIYVLMGVFVLYQWGILDGGKFSAKVRDDIGPWFAVSCCLNILWIFMWHFDLIGLSTAAIVLLLVSLILIRKHLVNADGNLFQRMAAKTGFSVYFGWIIAATIANISVWLTKLGWNGWGMSADFWTCTMLLIGSVIAAAVVLLGKDRIAALAVMWAYAGILFRHLSADYYNGMHPYVAAAAVLSELVILYAMIMPWCLSFGKKRCASGTVQAGR